MKPLAFLFLILNTVSYAYDCVPNSFSLLSTVINRPVKHQTWLKDLVPDGDKKAPTLQDSLQVWKKKVPDVNLVLNYSVYQTMGNNKAYSADNKPIQLGVPYLWIGYPDKEMETKPGESHSALVYFFASNCLVVNTMKVTTINDADAFTVYVENLTYKELLSRTIYIFEVSSKEPLTITPFANVLVVQNKL